MWQSTISLRYVSYKNADSNLHERICAMAMMAKNLLWSCAQIVAPRPPINPQRPNHAMERTTDRCTFTFEMTSTLPLRAPLFAPVALQRSRRRVVARARPETFSQRCLLSFVHPKQL